METKLIKNADIEQILKGTIISIHQETKDITCEQKIESLFMPCGSFILKSYETISVIKLKDEFDNIYSINYIGIVSALRKGDDVELYVHAVDIPKISLMSQLNDYFNNKSQDIILRPIKDGDYAVKIISESAGRTFEHKL
jgi:hypothetical protein